MKEMCFCSLNGEIVTRYSCDYDYLRQVWNRSIQKYPIAIVYCENYKDVSDAILWAKNRCVPIRVQSGGHNYEGYSTGNNVLVINISRMNRMKINYGNNTVKIDGGVTISQLYNYISSQGYPFPGGTCPTVGVSGYSLGGGWGLSSRKLGLGCDSLVEIELINYNGDLLVANEYTNKDLFWAIRGSGGGNYGAVVSMTFKLPNKVGNVTLFEIQYPKASINTQCIFFDTWQRWISKVDNDINMKAGIYNTLNSGMYVYAIGICYKNLYETQRLLQPFYQIQGSNIRLKCVTFLDAVNEVGETYPKYEYFKSTDGFVERDFSMEDIKQILSIVNTKRPEGSILTSINMYGLGGKVSQIGKYDTAFYYRDAKYILLLQSVFENNYYKQDNYRWVYNNYPYIYNLTNGSYVNFPYNKLYDYKSEYYGNNVFRLEYIKDKYDPCNIFSFPQGIGNKK